MKSVALEGWDTPKSKLLPQLKCAGMTLIEFALVATLVSLVLLMWWSALRQSAKNLPQADSTLLNSSNPWELPSNLKINVAPP